MTNTILDLPVGTDTSRGAELPSGSASPTARPLVITSRAPNVRTMRFFNPAMCALLRSRFHRLLSEDILLLTYTGRKSGRHYTLPVGYVHDGDTLLVVSQHAELKRWWRNLRGGAAVVVFVRGHAMPARADVVEEPVDVAGEVERLIGGLGVKVASRQLYMSLDVTPPPTQQQLAQALHGVVIVRITPEPSAVSRNQDKETKYVEQPAH